MLSYMGLGSFRHPWQGPNYTTVSDLQCRLSFLDYAGQHLEESWVSGDLNLVNHQ
jgi:hypothetical protein